MLVKDLKELIDAQDTTAAREFALLLCQKIDELFSKTDELKQSIDDVSTESK